MTTTIDAIVYVVLICISLYNYFSLKQILKVLHPLKQLQTVKNADGSSELKEQTNVHLEQLENDDAKDDVKNAQIAHLDDMLVADVISSAKEVARDEQITKNTVRKTKSPIKKKQVAETTNSEAIAAEEEPDVVVEAEPEIKM